MDKKQSLEILENAKNQIKNMSEEEKKLLSKRIDDFCDYSNSHVDTYIRTSFELKGSYEMSLKTGSYDINTKNYTNPKTKIYTTENIEENLIIEAA